MGSSFSSSNPKPKRLLKQLRLVTENPEAFSRDKKEIIKLSRKAGLMLEDPFETFQRIAYSSMPLIAARISQDHQIFQTLLDNQDKPTSAAALAMKTGINPAILDPLLDYMTAQFMVEEVSPRHYRATKLSRMLLTPTFVDGSIHFHDVMAPSFMTLNASLSLNSTAFSLAHETPLDYYTWVEDKPFLKDAFHRFMQTQLSSLPTFLSVFPFEKYVGYSSSQTPIFVDIGGGTGHQCGLVRNKFPSLKGRVILQDRMDVLKTAIVGEREGVERMAYDYTTDQPVKRARIYYFRQVLHNNDDETCVRILKSQLSAMDWNSVVVIDGRVLPNIKPSSGTDEYSAASSLAMWSAFKSWERTEGQWSLLLRKSGLEIREILRIEGGQNFAVIVAGRAVRRDSGVFLNYR